MHSQEDMIRFLRTKLEEKAQRVKDLEAELKESHSKEQVASDREDFLLNELAAQVHDLDCKSQLFLCCCFCCFRSCSEKLFCRYPR